LLASIADARTGPAAPQRLAVTGGIFVWVSKGAADIIVLTIVSVVALIEVIVVALVEVALTVLVKDVIVIPPRMQFAVIVPGPITTTVDLGSVSEPVTNTYPAVDQDRNV
jgi:K+-sensing histidine kinase KdpD